MFEDESVVVDVHNEKRAMLFRELDTLVVDQAAVLYGVNAGDDRVAQRDVAVTACSYIPHRRETGIQGLACIEHAIECLPRYRDSQALVAVKPVIARQVIVHVDQAGQHREPGQINYHSAGRYWHIRCVRKLDDLVTLNDDNLIAAGVAGDHVDELSRFYVGKRLICMHTRGREQENKR